MDVLFLLAGSLEATPEGFQRARPFVSGLCGQPGREKTPARVGVALYRRKG